MVICYFSVSDSLRKYDPVEAASAFKKCYRDLVGNGKCDWEIQSNAVGECNYDRKDCKETPECLDITVVLETKGDSEKCEKVNKFTFLKNVSIYTFGAKIQILKIFSFSGYIMGQYISSM